MMDIQSLAGTWRLRGEFIDVSASRVSEVLAKEGGTFSMHKGVKRYFPGKTGFLDAGVPCDVITPLVENGLLQEPLLKKNSDDCLWVKDYSWWFTRVFTVSQEMLCHEQVRLYIEILDFYAVILINGIPVAEHKNAFRPFHQDVKRFLKAGENRIVIRLTAGFEQHYPNDSITYYCANGHGIADQRVYLRKPAYTLGWDWNKPVPTCGIGREIRLEGISGAQITAFRGDTLALENGGADLELFFEIENLSMCSADDAILRYRILFGEEVAASGERELYVPGGVDFVKERVRLSKARLWWPNGAGEPNLYTVEAQVVCRGHVNPMPGKRIGVRTVSIRQNKLADGTREFRFVVNGVPIFCKGGNWVPTDSVYLRTPRSTYRTLVEEAKAQNFNMLRIWGGGMYEPDCFYDDCSENGILVMHDFMYACGYYPDYLDWFMHEAALEAEYQVRRLAHHACMAVWTGNNEIHESYTDWFGGEQAAPYEYGVKIFNYIQPRIVRANAPHTPYMPSSPFFGERANSLLAGDAHVWTFMGRDPKTRMRFAGELEAFDRLAALVRFSSEYGFHGPLVPSSVARFHDGEAVSFGNGIWEHHGESPGKRRRLAEGVTNHLTDGGELDEQGYLLYAGIMQGILYHDMALALLSRDHCSGDLIWMYNDCWPETGWTTIDYYLTRKHSFYFLRRAFDPRKLILRVREGLMHLVVRNDTPSPVALTIRYGSMTFAGDIQEESRITLALGPFDFQEAASFPAQAGLAGGFYYAVPEGAQGWEPATSLRGYYRDYDFPPFSGRVVKAQRDGEDLLVTVRADAYIPLVRLVCPDDRTRLGDNFFELLPGQEKTVRVYGCHDEPVLEPVAISRRDGHQKEACADEA